MVKHILFLVVFFMFSRLSSQTITMSNTNISTCSGTFYDPGGTGDYANDANVTMTICSNSAQAIYLQFTSFEVENNYDYLYIYNGNSTAAPQVTGSPFTGTTSPGTIFSNNASNCLTLVFTSDFIVPDPGWVATIGCGTPPPPPPPPAPGSCDFAEPFCTNSNYTFPASTGTTAQTGPDYGCLFSQPNPAWYYLQIANSGNISIDMSSSPARDIDFALWGPFTNLTNACNNLGSPIDCSYSGASTENAQIAGAVSGQYYILVITNFSNQATNISFSANGTATTNCNILCNITNITGVPGPCQLATNSYDVAGTMNTTAPPSSGTLTISSSCGGTPLTFNAPFSTVLNYTLTNIPTTNGTCTITAVYSADPTCTRTVTVTSPPSCSTCNITASNTGPYCEGQSISLSATTVNNANYVWRGPGGYFATGQNVTIPNSTVAMSGTYSLTAYLTSAAGLLDSCNSTTVVVVNPIPLVNAGLDDTLCINETATLNATGATTYAWNADPSLSSLTIANPIASPITTTTYTVTGTLNGCSATDQVVINVAPDFTITNNALPVFCFGECNGSIATSLIPSSGPYANYLYSWNTGQTTQNISNLCTGDYILTVENNAGCAKTVTVTVSSPTEVVLTETSNAPVFCFGGSNGTANVLATGGVPGYNYTWLPLGAVGSSNNSLTAGTYTVIAVDQSGCSDTINVLINQPTELVIDSIRDTLLCIGQGTSLSALISGGTAPYQISWNNGTSTLTGNNIIVTPQVTTNYTLSVTDANGCVYQNPLVQIVNVNPPLQMNSIVANAICEGDKRNVSVLASGGNGNHFFTWSPSANVTSLNPTSSSVDLTPNVTTTYTVIVNDDCGTPSSQTNFVLTVNPKPVLSIVPSKLQGCEPLSLTLAGTSSNSPTTCLWTFGDNTTSTVCGNVPKTFINDGVFQVSYTVNDANGCSNTVFKNITVHPLPVAIFNAYPQPANILEPELTFYNLTDANIVAQTWMFYDSIYSTSTLPRPTHEFTSPGEYDVTLIVVTDKGCIDTTIQTVKIDENISFYVPNAFTPDDDGKNDNFTAYGVGIENFKMSVYDRWGQIIKITDNINEGWDGKLGSGKKAEVGVYIYRIETTDIRKIKKVTFGHINLVR